jgi:3-deoxy-manno-octulosonate cytidylyltransferase (CMP-KDO synthetase)
VHPGGNPPKSPQQSRIVGAIPARYASERLPGKALADIDGRPMIEDVYRKAAAAETLQRVVVLTDDERIAEAVAAFSGECELTPSDCASGTDRIAFAARGWDVDAVVNIQGDEPLMDSNAIDAIARHLAENPDDPAVTLAAPAEPDDRNNPDVVKVVINRKGYALYFSRAPIPYSRNESDVQPLRHQGIYGYQLGALLEIAALEPSALERTEALEQLRMLENGYRLKVLQWEHCFPGVDTEEDLRQVREMMSSGATSRPEAEQPA